MAEVEFACSVVSDSLGLQISNFTQGHTDETQRLVVLSITFKFNNNQNVCILPVLEVGQRRTSTY